MLDERRLKVSDCDAVCLSMGPGSYTGLRVGSSTAKGLCFGGGIPLLAVGTLDVLAAQAIEAGLPEGCKWIVPMIDARRMEVYTALYSAAGERLTDVSPKFVDDSFVNNIDRRRLVPPERPSHPSALSGPRVAASHVGNETEYFSSETESRSARRYWEAKGGYSGRSALRQRR